MSRSDCASSHSRMPPSAAAARRSACNAAGEGVGVAGRGGGGEAIHDQLGVGAEAVDQLGEEIGPPPRRASAGDDPAHRPAAAVSAAKRGCAAIGVTRSSARVGVGAPATAADFGSTGSGAGDRGALRQRQRVQRGFQHAVAERRRAAARSARRRRARRGCRSAPPRRRTGRTAARRGPSAARWTKLSAGITRARPSTINTGGEWRLEALDIDQRIVEPADPARIGVPGVERLGQFAGELAVVGHQQDRALARSSGASGAASSIASGSMTVQRAPPRRPRSQGDPPAHQLDQPPDHGKASPSAPPRRDAGRGGRRERVVVESMAVRGMVADHELSWTMPSARPTAPRSILTVPAVARRDRRDDQAVEDLRELPRPAAQPVGQLRVEPQRQGDAPLRRRRRAIGAQRVVDHGVQVERLDRRGEVAGLDRREIEHLADLRQQRPRRQGNRPGAPRPRRSGSDPRHRVDRRAQAAADDRENRVPRRPRRRRLGARLRRAPRSSIATRSPARRPGPRSTRPASTAAAARTGSIAATAAKPTTPRRRRTASSAPSPSRSPA